MESTHTCWKMNEIAHCIRKEKWKGLNLFNWFSTGIVIRHSFCFFRNNCCKWQDEIAADRYFMSEHLRAAIRRRRTAWRDDVIVYYQLNLVKMWGRWRERALLLSKFPSHIHSYSTKSILYNIFRISLCVGTRHIQVLYLGLCIF